MKTWPFIFSAKAVPSIATVLLLAGCNSLKPLDPVSNSEYRPDNVFVGWRFLLPNIKRVAVLPMVTDNNYAVMIEGRDALDPVLTAELLKTKRFEVIRVTPEECRSCTGRRQWSGEEVLPEPMFASLREGFGCDAVLFVQLTTFRAYPPLAIGWRMKLVNATTREILWAGDELFDGGRADVQQDARRYQRDQLRMANRLEEGWTIQNSPRRFGQYTMAQLLATLPNR